MITKLAERARHDTIEDDQTKNILRDIEETNDQQSAIDEDEEDFNEDEMNDQYGNDEDNEKEEEDRRFEL